MIKSTQLPAPPLPHVPWVRVLFAQLSLVVPFSVFGIVSAAVDQEANPLVFFGTIVLIFIVINGVLTWLGLRRIHRSLRKLELDRALTESFKLPGFLAAWLAAFAIALLILPAAIGAYVATQDVATLAVILVATAYGIAGNTWAWSTFLVDAMLQPFRRRLSRLGARSTGRPKRLGLKILIAVAVIGILPIATALWGEFTPELFDPVVTIPGFISSIMVSVAVLLSLVYTINRASQDLVQATARLSRSEFDQPADRSTNDEFGLLAEGLNDAAESLRDKDRIRNTLGRVVSPEVATELLREDQGLSGVNLTAGILFVDIRSFTAISETMAPEHLVHRLNAWFDMLTAPIQDHGGIVNKFIGDAVLAVFGAPKKLSDPAKPLVQASLDILSLHRDYLKRLGTDAWQISLGVHVGPVVAGPLGSTNRMEYTVIGDAVNVASRLEGMTRIYQVPCVASLQSLAHISGCVYRKLDRVIVKGRQQEIEIVEPLGLGESLTASRHR